MAENPDQDRVLWRSRRGMLELDLFLVEFARIRYPELDHTWRDAYRELLEVDDPMLLEWLHGRAAPEPAFADIVADIIAFKATRQPER